MYFVLQVLKRIKPREKAFFRHAAYALTGGKSKQPIKGKNPSRITIGTMVREHECFRTASHKLFFPPRGNACYSALNTYYYCYWQ